MARRMSQPDAIRLTHSVMDDKKVIQHFPFKVIDGAPALLFWPTAKSLKLTERNELRLYACNKLLKTGN